MVLRSVKKSFSTFINVCCTKTYLFMYRTRLSNGVHSLSFGITNLEVDEEIEYVKRGDRGKGRREDKR